MTRKLGLLMRALALSTTLGLPLAHGAVIDFESGDLTGLYFAGDSFTQGDFTLTAKNSYGTVDTAGALGSQAPTGDATQFYFNSNDGSLLLSRTDGTTFDLTSFSAAFVPLDPASPQATVLYAVGTRADNSVISGYWLFAPSSGGKYAFADYAGGSSFLGLKQIEFHACSLVNGIVCTEATQNNGQFAIDNIAVSSVPETTTASLLMLGLLGLGLARFARRSPR